MSSSSYYFQHDYNTRMNARIKRLLIKHGLLGYGVFWAIVEDLYNNDNALPTDYESIAFDLRVECSVIESVIKDFGLFIIENGTFTSNSVAKRLQERKEKSEQARNSALKRWSRKADEEQPDSNGNANAMQTQSEGNARKESKGNKNERKPKVIKITYRPLVSLTEQEHKTLVDKHGQPKTDWMLDKLASYKESSGKTYKSDYGAINSWVVDKAEKDFKPAPMQVVHKNMTPDEVADLFGGRNPNYAG